jgi:SAM-dependent methyltransferase
MSENKKPDTFYDHFSREKPTGIGSWLAKSFSNKIFKYSDIPSRGKVLEVGPGRGIFANICLQQGFEYWAIEPNEQMATALENKGADVIRAKVPPLPALEKKFDITLMVNVMEHMNSMQDALQISQQIKDVLKPKGKFIICSPDYLNLRHHFFNTDFSHNYVTTRRRLQELLISAGFDKIKSCYLSGPFGGLMCFIISTIASRLPFGLFDAWFPDNIVFHKLYKLQLTFSRKVLILGENSPNQ